MKIENEIRSRSIEISCEEVEKDYYPSCRLRVLITTEEVVANLNRSVWVTKSDLTTFIKRLEILDKTRKGDEALYSTSPDEFYLRFRDANLQGHILVEVESQKRGVDSYSDLIRIAFEITPSSLQRNIADLKKILNEIQEAS